MFHSLRFRLLVVLILVVVAAVGGIALVSTQVVTRTFQGYEDRRGVMRDRRFEGFLTMHYARHGDWSRVQLELERIGQITGERVVLADGEGRIIADSEGELIGRPAQRGWGAPAARRMAAGDLNQRVEITSDHEIGDLARAFNGMADGLARFEELRRQLVTDVAHELRTPLTNVRGNLEALRDGVVEPENPVIDSLYEEAMLLNHLVDDLQELSLAEAGQLRLERQPVALADVVDQAVQALHPRAEAERVVLWVDLPEDLPLVDVDPRRIGQVLRNLLEDGLTHTLPDGEIGITARVACPEPSDATGLSEGSVLSSSKGNVLSSSKGGDLGLLRGRRTDQWIESACGIRGRASLPRTCPTSLSASTGPTSRGLGPPVEQG